MNMQISQPSPDAPLVSSSPVAASLATSPAPNTTSSSPSSRDNKSRKAPSAFRTISEVADALDVQQHVLRFWETKFSQIRPLKRGGGRRYYRPEDVALLEKIHHLLYTEGYTIKGVQKLLKAPGGRSPMPVAQASVAVSAPPVAKPGVLEDQLAAAEALSPDMTGDRARPGLSNRQRIILESMLGELKELRSLIKS